MSAHMVTHSIPTCELFRLEGIRVYFLLEPETKPVHSTSLRNQTIPRALENMRPSVHHYQFHRLTEAGKCCKPFPFPEKGIRICKSGYSNRGIYSIYAKT